MSFTIFVVDIARVLCKEMEMPVGHLKIFFGEEQEDKVFVLEEGKTFIIGRAKDADIRLRDIKVSRNHSEVRAIGGRCLIKDLGSRNSTFVNGEKISGEVELKDGDQIRLGFSVLQFFYAEPGSHVVESPAELKKCSLCGKSINEADLIAGRAEEVDGKRYCPECMAKMQDLFEEDVKAPAPAGISGKPTAPAAPVPPPVAEESHEALEPPPKSELDVDLADLIDDHEEEDLLPDPGS